MYGIQADRRGRDLFPVMVAPRQWGERHLFEAGEEHSLLVKRATGLPVKLDITTQDGRAIGPDGTVILRVGRENGWVGSLAQSHTIREGELGVE